MLDLPRNWRDALETSQQPEKFVFFRQSTILCLIVAFIGIKALQHVLAADTPRHLLVALLLLLLPAVFGSSSLRSTLREILLTRLRLEDAAVLGFFLLPIVCNVLFLPESWQQARINWQSWVWSELGLLSLLCAPIAEEYFFRGWLLKRQLGVLAQRSSLGFSAMLKLCYFNALAFWIMHMPIDLNMWREALPVGAVPVSPGSFLLGLMTSVLTLRTGNIRAALLFHAVANASGPLWWPLLGMDSLRSLFYQ